MQLLIGAILGLFIGLIIGLIVILVIWMKYHNLKVKYSPIINADAEVEKRKKEIVLLIETYQANQAEHEKALNKIKSDIEAFDDKCKTSEYSLNEIKKEIALYNENLELHDYGLYKPYYKFENTEKYKQELDRIYQQQKNAIKEEWAAECSANWTVNGSASEGQKQTKRFIKLMLFGFNGECDSIISEVSWNNVQKMQEKIKKIYSTVNKLGEAYQAEITNRYLDLMLKKLRLTHEYAEKQYQEKEEQRRIREQMREEEKARKEFDRAIKDAEDEEKRYQKALDKAREELKSAEGAKLETLQEKIMELERQIKEAEEARQRAVSQAQLTKSGHVYIISNIGSFGENIYKIGLTRRLDPLDRVKELGDASVPFEFDVHGMVYCEDAPALENELHQLFNNYRVNMVNPRKEFFKTSLADIERVIKKKFPDTSLVKTIAAREFMESEAIRKSKGII